MPRLLNRLPKYCKHEGGQAIVRLDGKVFYLGGYGTEASRIEYDRLTAEWLGNGRTLPRAAHGLPPVTVVELIGHYRRYAESYYKHASTRENIRLTCRMLREVYGHTLAASFGPVALQALVKRMIDGGLARSYINDNLARIRRLFRWAVAQGLVPANVIHGLECVAGERKGHSAARETEPVRPVDDAVVDATIPHLPPVVDDMVRLHRLIGCRPTELCIMRPADVDRSGKVWVYRPTHHKTEHHGHERRIMIGPKGQAILAPYLLRDAESFCFCPAESDRKRQERRAAERTTPLSTGNATGSNRKRRPKRKPGRCYSKGSYRKAVAMACEKAFAMPDEFKLPRPSRRKDAKPALSADEIATRRKLSAEWRAKHVWSPGQLRHNVGTAVRKKFGIEAASVTLGHRRCNVTEVYAEKNYDLAMQIAAEVG